MQVNRLQLINYKQPNFEAKPKVKKTQFPISQEKTKNLVKYISKKNKEKFEPIGNYANMNTPAYRRLNVPFEDSLLNPIKK